MSKKGLPIDQKSKGHVRKIILIRHGQYNMKGKSVDQGSLTKLGIQQAKLTGKRLKLEEKKVTLIASTKPRALQTAQEISKIIKCKIIESDELWECIPAFNPSDSEQFKDLGLSPEEFRKEADYAEAAFEKFIQSPGKKNEVVVIVSHGNLIRYFIARALGFEGTQWTRMSILQASINGIVVDSKGKISVLRLNDVGHIPPKQRSFL